MQSEPCLVEPPAPQPESPTKSTNIATTAAALLPTSSRPFAALSKHFPDGVAWGAAAWIAIVHLGALAAPWTFTWAGLG
ncbi:MAG: hypothetical protein SFV81_21505, partial [Pirellulaceae bacterium]|nr:hypothetical protein [Pirellulaceae bacterium]